MPSHHEHAAAHLAGRAIGCAALTISDTRSLDSDKSGDEIQRLLAAAGHELIDRQLVRDEPDAIEATLHAWLDDPAVAVVLTTGGTGIAARDTTIEVVRRVLTAELEGFGELFRMISFEEIGAAAMLSRAVGGVAVREDGRATFIFAMPGSPNAVRTAMERLIVPELAHLVWQRS